MTKNEVILPSDLTVKTIAEVAKQLLEALASCDTLIVEAGEVREIDSTGIQLLISLNLEVELVGCSLEIHNPSDEMLAKAARIGCEGLLPCLTKEANG